jgi:hypothetical protein
MWLRKDPAGSACGRSGSARIGAAKARGGSEWIIAFLLASALAAGGLAACGGSSGTASTSAEGGGAATTPAAAAPDYATLLTQDDVRAITGHKDATPMPESEWGMRAGSSKYFALYQGKDWPEALWLRVGDKGVFEESRKASDTPAETIPGLGDDAFWWDYTDVQRGLTVLFGDSTYEIITTLTYNKPQVTDDQLLEIARTVVGRL